MLYSDNVSADPLVHRPWFLASLLVVLTAILSVPDLTGTIFGQLLAPVIGEADAGALFDRLSIAFILSLLLILNIAVIGFLTFRLQVTIVWLELLGLFLLFFYGFDLNFPFIESKIGFMITQGVFTTLYVSAISIILAAVLAIFGAIAKLSSNGFAYAIASFYTSVFRGLPLLMQIYLIYLGLPQIGYVIDAVPAGILALTLCYGAYMTEIFRAGIQSIPKGQWEASRALGFKFGLTMRQVILPQSMPVIIPPTGNQFIAMLKDSSLVSVIGVWELMFLARTMGSKEFRHMEMLITAALIYWLLSICLELIQGQIERHFRSKSH